MGRVFPQGRVTHVGRVFPQGRVTHVGRVFPQGRVTHVGRVFPQGRVTHVGRVFPQGAYISTRDVSRMWGVYFHKGRVFPQGAPSRAYCIFAQLTNSNVGKLPIRDSNNRENWKLLFHETIVKFNPRAMKLFVSYCSELCIVSGGFLHPSKTYFVLGKLWQAHLFA